jgi:hypothetical protein
MTGHDELAGKPGAKGLQFAGCQPHGKNTLQRLPQMPANATAAIAGIRLRNDVRGTIAGFGSIMAVQTDPIGLSFVSKTTIVRGLFGPGRCLDRFV